ncbi:MAG TPA: DUF3455 domain-containing protein [Pyrinomonadaceae bacterium]|nr:DUF3455 domain-containing protein [Pyrinomonadaceae bacterium]
MHYITIKSVTRLLVLLAVVGIAGVALKPAPAGAMFDNNNGPELPAGCETINVEEGNKLAFHVYAKGAQIYKWNGTSWGFVAPEATLYAEPGYFGEVGIHGMGPHWTSKSGSRVKASRVPNTGCRPDSTAIEWLLLKQTETTGPGIFGNVTYIQRTNTTGGLAPSEPGTLNELREVPYTAEYYFYRAEGPQSPLE